MSWRYAFTREKIVDGEETFTIHEVYFDDDNNLSSWSADPIAPQADTFTGLEEELQRMLQESMRFILDLTEDPPVFITANDLPPEALKARPEGTEVP